MPMHYTRFAAAALFLTCAASVAAQSLTREDCEREFRPKVGQNGKDVIWVPTPNDLVTRMLQMANTTAQDYVIDLGAGDGKIAIAAAKQFGAKALGIEYNPAMVNLAQCMVQVEGVTGKANVVQGDVFVEDFSKATVLTMYLLPELNVKLRPTILKMAPGTRVVSHQFSMGDWAPDQVYDTDNRTAYQWVVPAQVAGTWIFKEPGGVSFSIAVVQSFQNIGGEATIWAKKQPLLGAIVKADEMQFAFIDDKGVTRHVKGKVRGNDFTGTLRIGEGELKISGSRT